LDNQKFRDWRDNSTSSLLWVTADPGCGKSVLSRALVDERLLSSHPEDTTICYFFFKDVSSDQRSVLRALSALLHQLFSSAKTAALIKHALPDFEANREMISSSFEVMWAIIERIAQDPASSKIVLLLDALDECEDTARVKLIEKLKGLDRTRTGNSSAKTNLKVLVTSRRYWSIESEFESLVHGIPSIHVSGEDLSERIRAEIDVVIKARVSRLKFSGTKAQPQLLHHLLRVKNRTYLWVHLVLEILRKKPRIDTRTVENFMKNPPNTLYKAYDAILDKCSDLDEARKLLHIVVAANRPLTLKEMEVALFLDNSTHTYEDLEFQGDEDFRVTIRDLCGLFVSIVDSRIFLIHQTAKEYLIATAGNLPSGLWNHSLELGESNSLLAKICITYLLLSNFENSPLTIQEWDWSSKVKIEEYTANNHFLDYAAKHWASHFRRAKPRNAQKLLELVLKLCDDRSHRYNTWIQIYWTTLDSRFIQGLSTLMIASLLGLDILLQRLLDDGANVNAMNKDGSTPLRIAVSEGHEVVVSQLLARGAAVDAAKDGNYTPLWLAVQQGHEVIVKQLLNAGACANVVYDYEDHTPLLLAVINGHTAIFKQLLKAGAQIDLRDSEGRTALLVAVKWWRQAAVQQLLDAGAQVDAMDNQGRTALWLAVEKGHEPIIELLLHAGAQVGARDLYTALSLSIDPDVFKLLVDAGTQISDLDTEDQTALMTAIRDKREDIAHRLLDAGAQLNTVDRQGCTALHLAVKERDVTMIRFLVDAGAQVDVKDNLGRTALSIAAYYKIAVHYKNEVIVQQLLDAGAQVNSRDNERRTPLLHAAAASKNESIITKLLQAGAR
jgi:ankyrin repeat protein